MRQLNQDKERDRLAARLKAAIPDVMRRWEALVLAEVPAARAQERLILYNDVPGILAELAQAIAIGSVELLEDSPASKTHARQRVAVDGYSISQVLQEYRLLRRSVVEVLQGEGPLDPETLALTHADLDQSIQECVTEYARLEQQALSESVERYRLLVEGVRDYAIYMLDRDGRVTSWNAGAQRLFGYAAEEVVGASYERFSPGPEARGGTQRELTKAAEQGRCESEGWRVRKDGTEFWASGTLTALYDPEGGLRGFSKVTRDITERKLLEDQLLQTADRLSDADQRKNEFLAILAHELRTPLSAITNSVYLLENIQIDERTVKQLGAISRQTRHLGRLVEDLMDISRISSGKIELIREPVLVRRVAEDAVHTVRSFIDQRGQSLTCSFPEEELLVEGDAIRLEQVFTNLLNNAAKYTEPGGEIMVSVEREADHAVIRVRDTGIGIEPVMLPSIFDLFRQVDASAARSHGGLGIGLALVKRLVELHGGTVSAGSGGPGQGSEFMVRLPLLSGSGGTPCG